MFELVSTHHGFRLRKVEFKVRLKVEQILVMIVKSKNLEILQFFFL